MTRVRKTYILIEISQDGNTLYGVYSSHRKALEALRQAVTQVARERNALDCSHLECIKPDEYRLVLPEGESRRYTIEVMELDKVHW